MFTIFYTKDLKKNEGLKKTAKTLLETEEMQEIINFYKEKMDQEITTPYFFNSIIGKVNDEEVRIIQEIQLKTSKMLVSPKTLLEAIKSINQ